MELFKFILAWFCVFLAALLLLVYILKRLPKRFEKLHVLDRYLRKKHIAIGKLLVVLGLMHGALSSYSLFSLNWGTLNWIILILLGASFYLRKRFLGKKWIWMHRFLSVLCAVTLIVHLVEIGLFPFQDKVDMQAEDEENIEAIAQTETEGTINGASDNPDATYLAGTYQATVDGYRPDMVVEVTLSGEAIESIDIVSHNERRESIYGPAMEEVPESIIKSQSVDVDNVSGATMTSEAIKEAVEIVLEQAKN